MPSQASISGVVGVYCVHNREKRKLTKLAFDPTRTKAYLCACCENMFLERTDTPMFCEQCRQPPTYPLAGPLPEPTGAIR